MSDSQWFNGPRIDERELGEKCQVCERRYLTVYRVPDSVWAKIGPKRPGSGGLLCPECADFLARREGITLYWSAKPNRFPSLLALVVYGLSGRRR